MSGTFNRLCHIDPKPVPWVISSAIRSLSDDLDFFLVLVLFFVRFFVGGRDEMLRYDMCVNF